MKPAIVNWTTKHLITIRPIGYLALIKLTFGLLVLGSLVSHNTLDPTPFNLLMPASGIENILGLPGALLSGLLYEILGTMAYIVPLLIIFLTRHKGVFAIRQLIPGIIEILVLTTLLAFLIPPNSSSGLQLTGVWGYVSVAALNQFPGSVYAIVILLCHQVFFFRDYRLDPTLFIVSGAAILFVYGFGKQFIKQGKRTLRKSAKYGSINWLSPLAMTVARFNDKIRELLQKKYQQALEKFAEANIIGKTLTTIGNIVSRNSSPDKQSDQNNNFQSPDSKDQLILQVIEEYRKSYYLSDSKMFLKLEEEI